jgi:hypothetical protein
MKKDVFRGRVNLCLLKVHRGSIYSRLSAVLSLHSDVYSNANSLEKPVQTQPKIVTLYSHSLLQFTFLHSNTLTLYYIPECWDYRHVLSLVTDGWVLMVVWWKKGNAQRSFTSYILYLHSI